MLYGMDISNYQSKIDLSLCPCDFVIMKATEGKTIQDKSFKKFALELRESNILLGCYHFARPDLHTDEEGIRAEARNFVRTVDDVDLLGEAILCLDWEQPPTNNEYFMRVWCEEVIDRTGVTPFIYANTSTMETVKKWDWAQWYPKWIAKWPSITRYGAGAAPKLTAEKYGIEKWKIWQYSSTGSYPGYSGNIDLDMCDMARDEWKRWASDGKEDEPEELSDDMKWAIENGLFLGYTDGRYHPEKNLTRNMLAAVLRRYHEKNL